MLMMYVKYCKTCYCKAIILKLYSMPKKCQKMHNFQSSHLISVADTKAKLIKSLKNKTEKACCLNFEDTVGEAL